MFPASSSFPVPGLPVFPGLGCAHCEYVCRSPYTLRNHIARTHPETRPGCLGSRQYKGMESLGRPVYCQRFFVGSAGSTFFEIQSSAQAKRLLQKPDGISRVAFIQTQANLDLDCDLAADQADDQQIVEQRDTTEISPWLELTQWPKYLHGHSFPAVAALAALPHECQEPLLVQFSQSLTRLIDRAYQTIEDRRVNKFDQIRINSFLQRPGVWDRPIQIYFKPSTYQRYRQVWQRLICFAYRTSRPGQPIVLRHQLTTAQLAALDRIEVSAQRLLHRDSSPSAIQAQLDEACLAFSIALLDHSLKENLFESVLVGFLAALGVDAANQTFHKPYGYTGYLSGLVKMAQILIVEQAVQMADSSDVAHPADALDAMREHFLLHGMRAPFGWITRLRTYRKKVQNTTTSQGYIY